MKTFKIDKKFYRYPLTIIILPVMILTLITMISWFVFYSPSIENNNQKSYALKKNVAEIDRKLKKQQQLLKKIQLAKWNIEAANIYSQQNKSTIKLLNDISKLRKLSKKHFSLTKSSNNSIVINLQPKSISKFYYLVESIESQEHIDRISITKKNNGYMLTVYARRLRDIKL